MAKKYVKINGKNLVIKTREKYAPKEKVVKMKTKYNRKINKQEAYNEYLNSKLDPRD